MNPEPDENVLVAGAAQEQYAQSVQELLAARLRLNLCCGREPRAPAASCRDFAASDFLSFSSRFSAFGGGFRGRPCAVRRAGDAPTYRRILDADGRSVKCLLAGGQPFFAGAHRRVASLRPGAGISTTRGGVKCMSESGLRGLRPARSKNT
jgi:hypothetical protein